MILLNSISDRVKEKRDKARLAFDRVLDSGWLILGSETKRFEENFADYIGVGYCVGVANGTDALELALLSKGLNAESTVATVANAGAYATKAIESIGATPLYMDVDFNTRCVSLDEVKKVAALADAVIVTHLYGRVVPEIQEIVDFCEQSNVALIEDCAQAHGATLMGKKAGSFASVATFSFYPTKNLGAFGDGGAVVCQCPKISESLRQLRQYGWSDKYTISILNGRNSRLDELQAAILVDLLPDLDEDNKRRVEAAQYYNSLIKHSHVHLPELPEEGYVGHLYVVTCHERDKLKSWLYENEIMSDIHYPIPDHLQPTLEHRYADIKLPITERFAGECLTLPLYPEIQRSQQDRVIESINSWQI